MPQPVDNSGRYVMVTEPANPVGIEQHPYRQPGWAPHLLGPSAAYGPAPGQQPVQYGQAPAGDDMLKDLLLLVAIGLAIYYLVIKPMGSGSGGKNKIVRLQNRSTGWFYKLMRKRAKAHGPFATRQDAVDDAESKGYAILSG